jgi:hypothetical protein
MDHSNVVGGSTAKRVINCPASVKLVQKMPPKPSSEHADRGTLLHNVIAELLEFDKLPEQCIGAQYKDQVLTQELVDEKIIPALAALDEIDPDKTMEYMVETRVSYGDFLPGVFGSTDLLGRKNKRAVVLDWKFGDGVSVDAENNPQLMFYAAAAMRTPAASWVFEGAEEIECIIVQPPAIRRWVTTPARIKEFEQELLYAVRLSSWPEPPMQEGDHCRWCAAKPICPRMTGATERALKGKLLEMPAQQISARLQQAEMLQTYINDLQALAFQMLDKGIDVPGYKLVAKQARRQWVEKAKIEAWVDANNIKDAYEPVTIKSPAQLEKVLKKAKIEFPADMVVSVSSGDTLAADSDPRPAVLQIGKQLTAALSKIQ